MAASLDGATWSAARTPVWARYVRMTMVRADGAPRTGIREIEVTAVR